MTDTGKIMWLWPEISAALATGKKLREVWEAIQADGLGIPYPQFRVYVSRVRSRQESSLKRKTHAESEPQPGINQATAPNLEKSDPFSNLKKQRREKEQTAFEFDPFSIRKDLIG